MTEPSLKRISKHLLVVFNTFRSTNRWLTNHQVAAIATNVSPRTVRSHTHRLVLLGIVEESRVFGGFLYRLNPTMSEKSDKERQRLEAAMDITAPGQTVREFLNVPVQILEPADRDRRPLMILVEITDPPAGEPIVTACSIAN